MEEQVLSEMVKLGSAIDSLAAQATHPQCKEVSRMSRDLLYKVLLACQDFGPIEDKEMVSHVPGLYRRGARVVERFGDAIQSRELKQDAANIRRWGMLAMCLQEGDMDGFRKILRENNGWLGKCGIIKT